MKTNKNCVERLYRYRNALFRLKYLGFVKVFSDNLADAVGVTSSQVRKDISLFGPSGNKRGGYLVDDLIGKLNEILGKNQPHDIIVIGAGNIGRALMHYQGFEKEGIHIVAAFDLNEGKVSPDAQIPVFPLSGMPDFVKTRQIQIAIVAVPDIAAQEVVDQLMAAGVKGILNFAPIRLSIPEHVVINHVNLGLELEKVIYYVNALNKESLDRAREDQD